MVGRELGDISIVTALNLEKRKTMIKIFKKTLNLFVDTFHNRGAHWLDRGIIGQEATFAIFLYDTRGKVKDTRVEGEEALVCIAEVAEIGEENGDQEDLKITLLEFF